MSHLSTHVGDTSSRRLVFATAASLEGLLRPVFFPTVEITFAVDEAEEHDHMPMLLSPFAYSTYRGS